MQSDAQAFCDELLNLLLRYLLKEHAMTSLFLTKLSLKCLAKEEHPVAVFGAFGNVKEVLDDFQQDLVEQVCETTRKYLAYDSCFLQSSILSCSSVNACITHPTRLQKGPCMIIWSFFVPNHGGRHFYESYSIF